MLHNDTQGTPSPLYTPSFPRQHAVACKHFPLHFPLNSATLLRPMLPHSLFLACSLPAPCLVAPLFFAFLYPTLACEAPHCPAVAPSLPFVWNHSPWWQDLSGVLRVAPFTPCLFCPLPFCDPQDGFCHSPCVAPATPWGCYQLFSPPCPCVGTCCMHIWLPYMPGKKKLAKMKTPTWAFYFTLCLKSQGAGYQIVVEM